MVRSLKSHHEEEEEDEDEEFVSRTTDATSHIGFRQGPRFLSTDYSHRLVYLRAI